MQECDRSAFLDAMIEAVATKRWLKLSPQARAVFPVVGSHAALFGTEEPITLARICEHSGLTPAAARAALGELHNRGLVDKTYLTGTDEIGYRLDTSDHVPLGGPAQHAQPGCEAVGPLGDDSAVHIHGDVTIHVEQPSAELIQLAAALTDMLSAQAKADERDTDRIAQKIEIIRYKDPIPDPRPGGAARPIRRNI